jgi:hypothetical protein
VDKKVLARHTSFSICVDAEPQSLVDEVVTVKSVLEVTVVPPTVTAIFPVVAPVGTVTVSCVEMAALTVACVPLKVTVLLPIVLLKLVPVMVTVAPTRPLAGLKLVMVGLVVVVVVTVKSSVETTDCSSTVTVIFPVVAPVGTVTTKVVDEALEIVATVPLNDTALLANIALKFNPVIVTVVPTGPLVGVKLVIDGAGTCSSSSLQAEIINTLARIRMTPVKTTFGFRFLFSDFMRIILL